MDNKSPTKHYGFAQVPRLILRGEKYRKKLSLAEKGLYACLKDICGETGECYYSLRNLAEEIGTSASTLTRYIPNLRDKGLIYAEKKIRGTGENKHEIWHIRIVDIWKENDALYSPQDCPNLKQSSEEIVSDCNNVPNASTSVSDRNENGNFVSDCNDTVSDCNKDCFILLANEYLNSNDNQSNNKDNIITDQPATTTFVADATTLTSSEKSEQNSSPMVSEPEEKKEAPPELQKAPVDIIPAMPSETAKWCPETLVQIVEFKRNKRFLEVTRGKSQKPQRQRQLDAAKKIIDAEIKRDEFIKAYDTRNDAWWQNNRGDLTVVDMAAKTTKNVMRTLEVLENISSKKGKKPTDLTKTMSSHHESILPQEEKDYQYWLVSTMEIPERTAFLKTHKSKEERYAIYHQSEYYQQKASLAQA